jgi:ubiquinone/menaquinone biosynthesis C-methylase UbiE
MTPVAGRTDWSSRAATYDNLKWASDDSLLLAMAHRATAVTPKRVLDLGTGTGKILIGLKSALPRETEFWGIDLCKDMLAKIPAEHRFKLVVDDAERLEYVPEGYFDLVTARMVFHHVHDVVLAGRASFERLRPGGHFVICEGVPPTQRCVHWYTEMFRFKEDRHTLPEGDLINLMVQAGFQDIVTDTVIMPAASLNNWLDNSGTPQGNIEVIKRMHHEAPESTWSSGTAIAS